MLDVDLLRGFSTAQLSYAIKVISLEFYFLPGFPIYFMSFDIIICIQLHAGETFDYAWTLQLKNQAGELNYIWLFDWSVYKVAHHLDLCHIL